MKVIEIWMAAIAAALFGCGGPSELEVFGTAAHGLTAPYSEPVFPGNDGVLQTMGRKMLVTARWTGPQPASVQLSWSTPLSVEEAQADDGTALPETMELPLERSTAGVGEASAELYVPPNSPLIFQPGAAWKVEATALADDGAMLAKATHAVWIGDAPGDKL